MAAFGVVEYRSRNPEWKEYQVKGINLALAQLSKEMSHEHSSAKRLKIQSEIESLRNKKPEIREISPFGGKLPPERCLTCHFGIEDLSKSHPNSVFGCVTCHGGNGFDLTVRGAHAGLKGGRNPATLALASSTCGSNKAAVGSCHSEREHPLLNRIENVPKSLMATNAGIIGVLRFQWGIEQDSRSKYGIKQVSDGRTSLSAVPRKLPGQVSSASQTAISGSFALPATCGRRSTVKTWDDSKAAPRVMLLTEIKGDTWEEILRLKGMNPVILPRTR